MNEYKQVRRSNNSTGFLQKRFALSIQLNSSGLLDQKWNGTQNGGSQNARLGLGLGCLFISNFVLFQILSIFPCTRQTPISAGNSLNFEKQTPTLAKTKVRYRKKPKPVTLTCCVCAVIGSFSNRHRNGNENVISNINSCHCKLLRDYSKLINMTMVAAFPQE